MGDYILGVGMGSLAGAAAPWVGIGAFAGSVIGGGEFFGKGMQVGGLIGGMAGGGYQFGWKALAVESVGVAGGGTRNCPKSCGVC